MDLAAAGRAVGDRVARCPAAGNSGVVLMMPDVLWGSVFGSFAGLVVLDLLIRLVALVQRSGVGMHKPLD